MNRCHFSTLIIKPIFDMYHIIYLYFFALRSGVDSVLENNIVTTWADQAVLSVW